MYILVGWHDEAGNIMVSDNKEMLEEYRSMWLELFNYDDPNINEIDLLTQAHLDDFKKQVKAKRQKEATTFKKTHCVCGMKKQKTWNLCPYCGVKLGDIE